MFGFRLNKKLEPVFQDYLEQNCYTASEFARTAVEERLRKLQSETDELQIKRRIE
jgi:hypothetical protein